MQRYQELHRRRDASENGERDPDADKRVTERVRQWWGDLRPGLKKALEYQHEARASGVHPIPAYEPAEPAPSSRLGDVFGRDGLLEKQARVRGRIGQPSVPIGLRAHGAYTIGIKVRGAAQSRRAGHGLRRRRGPRNVFDYAYPDPRTLFAALESKLARVNQALGAKAGQVVGVGVAAPLWLGGWRDFLGAPPDALEAWP